MMDEFSELRQGIALQYWEESFVAIPREKETLADHAEAWWREKGFTVPKCGSEAWWIMYEKWVDYAFSKEAIGECT